MLVFVVNKVAKAKMDGRGKVSLKESCSTSTVHQFGGDVDRDNGRLILRDAQQALPARSEKPMNNSRRLQRCHPSPSVAVIKSKPASRYKSRIDL